MARRKRNNLKQFRCSACTLVVELPRLVSRCPECQAWDTLDEVGYSKNTQLHDVGTVGDAIPINQVKQEKYDRFSCGMPEVDKVLSGGFVPGCGILLYGGKGVGKSTLSSQLAGEIAAKGKTVLYLSGEEPIHQAKIRFDRFGHGIWKNLLMTAKCDIEQLEAEIIHQEPDVVIIDSIQKVHEPGQRPGSNAQVRNCAEHLYTVGKQNDIVMIFIGHVVKDGSMGGPETLAHLVDVVLEFSRVRGHDRLLRPTKIRFGPETEFAFFKHTDKGLIPIADASSYFLEDRTILEGNRTPAGVALSVTAHDTRPVLVEIQSLLTPWGAGDGDSERAPKTTRRTSGVDAARIAMLIALFDSVSERPTLRYHDVYVAASGGLSVKTGETTCDLAVIASLFSRLHGIDLPANVAFLGECDLVGGVRSIPDVEQCVRELQRHGISHIVLPSKQVREMRKMKGLEFTGIQMVSDLFEVIQEDLAG